MSVELPFTLTHPKPEPCIPMLDDDIVIKDSKRESKSTTGAADAAKEKNGNDQTVPIDLNLIEFDTR